MIIIPAIDIMDGRVVRLFKGEFDKKTVYSDDPVDVALAWQQQGARLIHIVDLDGTKLGQPVNISLIEKVATAVDIPVQVGGGLRTMDSVKKLLEGKKINRVILGSAAFTSKGFLTEALACYGERIVVSIDARDGQVACDGWTTTTSISAPEAAQEMEQIGVKTIIFTDISSDGTLGGPRIGQLSKILGLVTIPVIASGGMASVEDIIRLKQISPRPPDGVIIGRALYEGKINLKEAIEKGL